MPSNLVVIAGHMQAGKTTAANMISSFVSYNEKYALITGFAHALKQFCIDSGWITEQQAYGSNDDKNTLTPLMLTNMPTYYTSSMEPIPMSAREVLQYIGTDIFRRIDKNFWVNKTIKDITEIWQTSNDTLIIIDDARFPNEILEMKKFGAITIYLTRNLYNSSHQSEIELDNFDKSNFDYIIDNQNYSIDELGDALKDIIKEQQLNVRNYQTQC